MDSLEGHAETLTKEFIKGQYFKDIASFVQYTVSLKHMHIEEMCQVCTTDNPLKTDATISSGCVLLKRTSNSKDGSLTTENSRKSARKSRRSVCVQKLTYSFSESDENGTCDADNNESESEDDEVFISKRKDKDVVDSGEEKSTSKIKDIDIISSGDEEITKQHILSNHSSATLGSDTGATNDDDDGDTDVDNAGSPIVYKKKNTRKISSESDPKESEEDQEVLDKEAIDIVNSGTSSESEESKDESIIVEKKSDTLKNNVYVNSSSDEDEDDYNKFLSNCQKTKSKKYNRYRDNVSISSDDTDDFVTPLRNKVTNITTPKTVFKTPRSSLAFIIDKLPSTDTRTPKYKRHFNNKKDEIVKELYSLYNRTVFDYRLPEDLQITWNKRMTKTAGFCYLQTSCQTRKSRIELSTKVVDTVERLRDTLIHELCHAAAWIFDGKRGHGAPWKYWAVKANKQHPELPIIETCHHYEIETKYKYQCEGCSTVFGRHTKSIDETKHSCGKCGGRPLLLSAFGNVSDTPKRANAYSQYVKKHFSRIKGENPECNSREVMKKVAEDFRAFKITENKENIG